MNREDIELLASQVRRLSLELPIQNSEFQGVVDANIGKKNAVAKVQQVFLALASERDSLIVVLRQAIEKGSKLGYSMVATRKLAESLVGGLDSPSPLQFVFDSIVELKQLAERTKSGSKVQPDHKITQWVKQHGKGRKDSEAVRAYIELHGGKYDKLYSDLQNDKKKHRKQQPKHG